MFYFWLEDLIDYSDAGVNETTTSIRNRGSWYIKQSHGKRYFDIPYWSNLRVADRWMLFKPLD